MASREGRLPRTPCQRAGKYRTYAEAIAAALAFLNTHPGADLITYRCRLGRHWHIGHTPGRVMRLSNQK